MRYTVDDIMDENPCARYTRERVDTLWAGRDLSPHDIAGLDIPVIDRTWALGRLLWRLSPYRANRVTRMVALDVADHWPCPDICWYYMVSGDATCRASVRDAAGVAARAAARATDSTADSTATWVAALAAARGAVWAAARGADLDAVWNASMHRYLEWIVRFGWEV